MTKKFEYLTVAEYAKKHNLKRTNIYQDIYCKRIPENRVKKIKVCKEMIKIKDKI